MKILIHLTSGIGNILFVTPVMSAFLDRGHHVDVFLEADYPEVVALIDQGKDDLFVSNDSRNFTAKTYDAYLIGWGIEKELEFQNYHDAQKVRAEYSKKYYEKKSETEMYFDCAKKIDSEISTGFDMFCHSSNRVFNDITKKTVVLYPGCKNLYPMKRWDKFHLLAEKFDDVALVGTEEDLDDSFSYYLNPKFGNWIGKPLTYKGKIQKFISAVSPKYRQSKNFPKHVKNYIGKLSLLDTAALIQQAGLFIGNDGGVSYVSAALGQETYVIFGASSIKKVNSHQKNIHVIQTTKKLDCQPCQFSEKYPDAWSRGFIGCPIRMECLKSLTVSDLISIVNQKFVRN